MALSAWWASPLGRSLLAAEADVLGEAMEDVFGWELLQVGAWGGARELLARGRTRRKSLVSAPGFAPGADIIARPAQLPVLS
ncbi:MAG TPA: SAM-dependent methyltransferase, partial [Candidatus Dormibacteraeota bacterium]|nr:SAM-dependent methyltransferase [Candidatus Dormibacteraeota bacterium]